MRVADVNRQRLGWDLHDSLGQHLHAIAFHCHALVRDLEMRHADEVEDARRLEELVFGAMKESRALARGLVTHELEGGLVEALTSASERCSSVYGIPCVAAVSAEGDDLSPAVAEEVYRIAQQAISNAIQHARPTRIDLRLAAQPGAMVLTVDDDGVGLGPGSGEGSGMGMAIMRLRSGLVGGSIRFTASPSGGTRVRCQVPHSSANGARA